MRSLYGSGAAAMAAVMLFASLLLYGCGPTMPPLKTVPSVDIPRFMGDWYVIANIPTFIEEGAHNAVESYRLDADGTIATTFTFHKDAFDGPVKTYTPRGFVVEGTGNAVWGMRFLWPIKAEYLITHLDDSYSETIISRNKRDYVWIMARSPVISDEAYARLAAYVASQGYDMTKLQKVPQRWPDKRD